MSSTNQPRTCEYCRCFDPIDADTGHCLAHPPLPTPEPGRLSLLVVVLSAGWCGEWHTEEDDA